MFRNFRSVYVYVFLLPALLNASCTSSPAQTAVPKNERTAKMSPELTSLYEEYSRYLASHKIEDFHPRDSSVRIVEDRVVIDAVAAHDANILRADLISLGMRDAVAFGRIVSGQLPISAIPAMAKLPSLQFARASSAIQRGSSADTGRSSKAL